MVWIVTTHEHLQELKSEKTNAEFVSFNKNNTAQVSESVAESLTKHDGFELKEDNE